MRARTGLRLFWVGYVVGLVCSPSSADIISTSLRIDARGRGSPGDRSGGIEIVGAPDGGSVIRLDLAPLRGRAVLHARLLLERDPIDGSSPEALLPVEVLPLRERYSGSGAPLTEGRPLELSPPWYRSVDATDVVRAWASGTGQGDGFLLRPLPGWRPERTRLDVEMEGSPGEGPPQPTGLRVIHRRGQTFISWREIDRRIGAERVSWGELRRAMAGADAETEVRYRIYRSSVPITRGTLGAAELLAEVEPHSSYNVEGRSLEALIYMHRRRSHEDIAFARELARKWYFGDYRIDMPEMDEVIVDRFVIEEGAGQLPLASGLYVHSPPKEGEAHYAVATCVDGTTNTADFSAANATASPVKESVGTGLPVLQGTGLLRVFWDYPGERRHYVQWCAPPLANLPNRAFNWSVFLPRDRPSPAPVRVYLGKDQYLRPVTPHRRDTILVAGRDGPPWSFWYGYHESLGTLRSFREGVVQPYTRRRLFAFLDWVVAEFDGDPNRLSAVGGSEALYYGVKHGDRFAYVLAHEPDPNPQLAPALVRIDDYERHPPRKEREAVWGLVEWRLLNDEGRPVWDELDLISWVREKPLKDVAFLSLGPASLSAPWPRQVEIMKALWEAKQPFCARFYWGGGEWLPLPETETSFRGTGEVFDLALDLPTLALKRNEGDRGLDEPPFADGVARYWSGGRIADGRRWLPDTVDEPDRFEATIHGRGRVAYAGGGRSDVTPRRTARFRPKPGDRFLWETVDLESGRVLESGEVAADEHGLVTVPQVLFGEKKSRLRIRRAE